MGTYFVETGSNQRGSTVVYDRDHAAIAQAVVDEFDLAGALLGATWFHISGITPALSREGAALTEAALVAAKAAGATTSIDLNYRAKLWNYGKTAPDVMGPLMAYVDVAIGNEEDCQNSLGIGAPADVTAGELEHSTYEALTAEVADRYPHLQAVAVTLRESKSADINGWSACLRDSDGFRVGRRYEMQDIVDRVGGGDSFAGGLIYGLISGRPAAEALDFAIAASALKHSIPGDFNRVSVAEVDKLLGGDGSGRVVR